VTSRLNKWSATINFLFPLILVTVLCGGMYYDLGHKFSLLWKILFLFIIIAYPVFVIVSFLAIPKIEIKGAYIYSTNVFSKKKLLLTQSKLSKNRRFYLIEDSICQVIKLPHKWYVNEKEILEAVSDQLSNMEALDLKSTEEREERLSS